MTDPDLTAEEWCARTASAALLDLIERLDRWGLLEGAVRASVARSVEVFRLGSGVDPGRAWEPGLRERYEQLHGGPPESPSA